MMRVMTWHDASVLLHNLFFFDAGYLHHVLSIISVFVIFLVFSFLVQQILFLFLELLNHKFRNENKAEGNYKACRLE